MLLLFSNLRNGLSSFTRNVNCEGGGGSTGFHISYSEKLKLTNAVINLFANKIMSTFYLSYPLVLNELRLQDDDFRIYQHCCRQFNVKTLNCFIRLVDIAGQFQISVDSGLGKYDYILPAQSK